MKMAGKGMSGFSSPWKGMLASKLSFWAVKVDVEKKTHKKHNDSARRTDSSNIL